MRNQGVAPIDTGFGKRGSMSRVVSSIASLILLSACALGTRGRPADEPAPSPADVDRAVAALQAAEARYEAGEYATAAATADSLFDAWRSTPSLASLQDRALWLRGRALEGDGLLGQAGASYEILLRRTGEGAMRDAAVRRLASVRAATGQEADAVHLLLENPGVLDEQRLDDLRRLASALSAIQLRALAERFEPRRPGAAILHVQLAQLLAADGRSDSARTVARAVLAAGAPEPERGIATLIAEAGDVSGREVRIGAILPLTGDLASVGQLLREGLELALDGYRDRRPDGFRVSLELRDDGSDPERAAGLLEGLERGGVLAVVGPLRSESFAAAARARANPRLPLISPTATEVLEPAENAYTLYDLERRERDVAVDLAEWSATELGLHRGAVLYPSDAAGRAAARAFGSTFESRNGLLLSATAYDPDSTTFRGPIETIAAAGPDLVFIPAPSPSKVLVLAPQLFYYGLDRSVVLGSASWGDPEVVRRLESVAADYRVIGLWVDRSSDGTRWRRFNTDYEMKYRKPLRENILPALAHDALLLILEGLEGSGLPIPAAVAAYLERAPEIAGASGRLVPDPATSTVRRRTQIRMLRDGRLERPDRSEILRWLAEARARDWAPPARRDSLRR